jgi:hypothetical protein
MIRLSFLKISLHITAELGMDACFQTKNTYIPTLRDDYGFKKTFCKMADNYEDQGLSACLNIISSEHLDGYGVSKDVFNYPITPGTVMH